MQVLSEYAPDLKTTGIKKKERNEEIKLYGYIYGYLYYGPFFIVLECHCRLGVVYGSLLF